MACGTLLPRWWLLCYCEPCCTEPDLLKSCTMFEMFYFLGRCFGSRSDSSNSTPLMSAFDWIPFCRLRFKAR